MTDPIGLVDALTGLAALSPVSLDDLDAQAALLTRRDRKYLVPLDVAERLVGGLADQAQVLEVGGRRRFRYESVYFDTPGHMSYLGSARRRAHRFKVRTRAYLDTGRCVLEVKTRDGRGRTVKTQHARDLARRGRLDASDRMLVGRYPEDRMGRPQLEPAVTTCYTRATLLLGAAGSRATLDTDVTAVAPDGRLVRLDGMAIVESKSAGPPSAVDRLLWSFDHRPVRISKFGTGLAALFPELPSNKWHRALHASWRVQRSPWDRA